MSPRPRRDFTSLYVRLGEAAKTKLERLAAERSETQSDLIDHAIRLYLRRIRSGERGITLLPAKDEARMARFNVEPDTARALDDISARFGYTKQAIVRAALAAFLGNE